MTQLKPASIPGESPVRIFLRFLRFGLLAWGGPVAQIAMIRQELVDEERWATNERFNRVLAVYQVLPGPEAHELCVYFGMMAGGRLGAVLAGLGFMLPGFVLMLALSWFYVSYGIASPIFAAVFYGFQASIGALIVRAVHRIGEHALQDGWLWGIAILSAVAKFFNINFILALVAGGLLYAAARRQVNGAWMTDRQFLDGLALSSILPAPLIIFSTFVGYLGNGWLGAVTITLGVFLPAFLFKLIGHSFFERMIEDKRLHAFLDGVTAGVVGLIGATALQLLFVALPDIPAVIIFMFSLIAVYRWKAKAALAVIVLTAGLLGLLVNTLL